MGVHAHSVTAAVDPAVVWERWTDPEHWASDNPWIVRARLNGPVAKGATGLVRLSSRGRWPFKITEADRAKMRFTTESKLPLAVMELEYTLERPELDADADPSLDVDPDARLLTHRVVLRGPLAKLWDRLLGKRIAELLPIVVGNIASAAGV